MADKLYYCFLENLSSREELEEESWYEKLKPTQFENY